MTITDESFAVYIAGEQIDGTELGMTYIHVTTPIGRIRMTAEEAATLGSALQHAAEFDREQNHEEATRHEWMHGATITVHGEPAGQGQITFLGKGRGAKHTNEKTLKPWRRAIIRAVRDTTGCHGYTDWNGICLTCRTPKQEHGLYANVPTRADITITVDKPKSNPKRRQTWPITRSSTDIDHHARACLDSLSESGVIKDDSQVIELSIRKVYPGEHPEALDQPGAIIRLYTLTGATS